MSEASLDLACPICGGSEFIHVNRRDTGRCKQCSAMERHRLAWMVMQHYDVLKPGLRVLHLAPERGMAIRIFRIVRDGYYPTDIQPERFSRDSYKVRYLDCCAGLAGFADARFDLILHNHVLEHVPCDVAG